MTTIEEARESPKPYMKNNKVTKSTTFSQRQLSTTDDTKQRKKKSVERGRSFLEKKSSSHDEQSDRQVWVWLWCVGGCGL